VHQPAVFNVRAGLTAHARTRLCLRRAR
jgi:hypothetical protein